MDAAARVSYCNPNASPRGTKTKNENNNNDETSWGGGEEERKKSIEHVHSQRDAA